MDVVTFTGLAALVSQQVLGVLDPAAVPLRLQAQTDVERAWHRLRTHW